MSAVALLRDHIQTVLGPDALLLKQGVAESFESMAGGVPRGALTEIAGPASSGRMSLLVSLLAAATSGQEFCALLDATDRFDPGSAEAAGVRLSQVLWVRCRGSAEHALKASDLLANAGGFGLIAIDLADVPVRTIERIPLAAWFRLRHAIENTRTALVVVGQRVQAGSCSALKIELDPGRAVWRGRLPGCLLEGFEASAQCTRNHRAREQKFAINR